MRAGRCLVILLLVVLMSNTAFAGGLSVQWTYSSTDQKSIDGFRIYNHNNVVVLDNIAPGKRSVKLQKPSVPTGFYCVAYGGGKESKPSRIALYVPPVPPLHGPVKFILTLEPIK